MKITAWAGEACSPKRQNVMVRCTASTLNSCSGPASLKQAGTSSGSGCSSSPFLWNRASQVRVFAIILTSPLPSTSNCHPFSRDWPFHSLHWPCISPSLSSQHLCDCTTTHSHACHTCLIDPNKPAWTPLSRYNTLLLHSKLPAFR